jgi:hypothetical protein
MSMEWKRTVVGRLILFPIAQTSIISDTTQAYGMNQQLQAFLISGRQNVRPSEPTAETYPKLQPLFFRLSAMISHYFTAGGFCRFCAPHDNEKWLSVQR